MEKKNESRAVITGLWKRCHSEISSPCYEAYHGPSSREIKHAHTCIHTCTHVTFIRQSLSFPPAHGGEYRDSKMPSTQFSKIHSELLSIFTTDGPWGFLQDTLAFIQKPLLSDSDSNAVQFPDHGKRFPLNFPSINLDCNK